MEIALGERAARGGLDRHPGGCKAASCRGEEEEIEGWREGEPLRLELRGDENRAACSRRRSVSRVRIQRRRDGGGRTPGERVRIDGGISGGHSREIGERDGGRGRILGRF